MGTSISAAPKITRIGVAPGQPWFVDSTTGKRVVIHGFNYTAEEWKAEKRDQCRENWIRFDESIAERDLGRIAAAGGNTIRVFLSLRSFLPQLGVVPEDSLRRAEALVRVAKQHHIHVIFGGPDWWEGCPDWCGNPDNAITDDRFLNALAGFWRAFVARFRGEPAVLAYTLKNEAVVPWLLPDARWHDYLRRRYGVPAAVGEAWRTTIRSWPECARPADQDRQDDPQLYDYQLAREYAAYRYARRQVEAIREADPDCLVTYGGLQYDVPLYRAFPGRPSGYSGFDTRLLAPLFDFTGIHWYQLRPDNMRTDDAYRPLGLRYLRMILTYCRVGQKPLLLEEGDMRIVSDESYAQLAADHLAGHLHWEWLEVARPKTGLDPAFAAQFAAQDRRYREKEPLILASLPVWRIDKRCLLTWYADTFRHNPEWQKSIGTSDANDTGGFWTDEFGRRSEEGMRGIRIEVDGVGAEEFSRMYCMENDRPQD